MRACALFCKRQTLTRAGTKKKKEQKRGTEILQKLERSEIPQVHITSTVNSVHDDALAERASYLKKKNRGCKKGKRYVSGIEPRGLGFGAVCLNARAFTLG